MESLFFVKPLCEILNFSGRLAKKAYFFLTNISPIIRLRIKFG